MLKTLRCQAGMTLVELVLAGVIFAIIAPGILLIFNKGMESFSFERDELAVQSDIRSVMDRMTDKLRQATSVTRAKKDDIVFDADGYYYKNKNVYEGRLPVALYGEGNQLNSQGIEVIDFSFSYYGEDMATLTTNPDPDEVKAVEIKMEFQKDDNPIMELESLVLVRNLL